jgi:hemoglobin
MTSERQIFIPPGGNPQGINPSPEIYDLMGEEAIFKMLEDFYAELECSPIRSMFPEDMKEASKKSAAFFVFILGGPPLYQNLYGSPRMRQRHLPFQIDERARQIWLSCFEKILQDAQKKYQFPKEHLASFRSYLEKFSSWMVNTSS